jgi:hypothetical protein
VSTTLLRANQPGTPVGTIAICTRDSISAPTAISWMMMDNSSFLLPGEYVGRFIVQGHILPMQRNECLQRMEGEWILFIDDDMTFQPDAVSTLVKTANDFDLDIVGGLCFQRGAPFQPTLYKQGPGGQGYTFMEVWPEDTAVEVDATGMAFTLITRRALEKMVGEWPTYEERQRMPAPPIFKWGQDGLGEDFGFCREAREAGLHIFVDTSVKVGHIATVTIDENSFYQQVALRPPEALAARREQLAALGLEPMLPGVAREKLSW